MRRPAPLLAPPYARLVAYTLLAAVGALQWVRYVDGTSSGRAVGWLAAGAVSGLLVLTCARLPRRWVLPGAVAAALAGGVLAVLASGLELRLLLPEHWAELGDGVARGAQALNTVRLPYLGRDPWVLATVELCGALLCWGAAVATAWPRGGAAPRLVALTLLLVLAASPVVSMGAASPVWLGLALAVLTAGFLWLERLSRRPGLGLAVLLLAVLAVAVPLGTAADREEPWFDYKAFSENFTGGPPITFDWSQGLGPIDWPREGAEVLRVVSPVPLYWKADELVDFDGERWATGFRREFGEDAADALPPDWRERPGWTETVNVSLRRLSNRTVVGPGTILDVRDPSRPVEADAVPGRWVAAGGRTFDEGDTYTVQAHVPRPSPTQLASATSGRQMRALALRTMRVEYRDDAVAKAPTFPEYPDGLDRRDTDPEVTFLPFGKGPGAVARYVDLGIDAPGDRALRNSGYARTWALAKRLRRRATSPYDYVVRVNAYLRRPGFRYSEVPPPAPPGDPVEPLDRFLFDTRLGYCQHYAGAMALLLRMGGIPARVATGFSPGGFRKSTGDWIVRDTDAHAWVEAWFDKVGWVTFDPTPPQTPARSQVAVIATPEAQSGGGAQQGPGTADVRRRPEGLQREPIVSGGTGAAADGGGPPTVIWVLGGLLLLTAAGGTLFVRRSRRVDPLAELERALRRSGRDTPTGTTLVQLERRLGTSADGAAYLRALRAARYGSAAAPPTNAQRAAFRRELAAGLGPAGKLRALWALPPVYPVRRGPR